MTNDPDHLLIDRILAGETNLFALLVDRYKSYVFTIVLKVLQLRPEAEEAAQDAFMKALHGLKGFNKQSKFSTWLYRISFNTAVTYKRKQKMKLHRIEHAAITPADADEGVLETSDRKRYMNRAMARLNEADRVALTMFYLNEFSLDEIASITGMQSNTIKVRIHRARIRMAEELKSILNTEALTL